MHIRTAATIAFVVCLTALGCAGRGSRKQGAPPYVVSATGIGRAPDGTPAGPRARLAAEAAAEADAERRLCIALHGSPSGQVLARRRVAALLLEDGWALVTVEAEVDDYERYVRALTRLHEMEPAVMKAVDVLPGPRVIETVEPWQP